MAANAGFAKLTNGENFVNFTFMLPEGGVGESTNTGKFSILHSIVTYNTPRARDLNGRLFLKYVSGDPGIVTMSPISPGGYVQVVEPGHDGCGVHDWHTGVQDFSCVPKRVGKLVLRARVDPDPEYYEGDGDSANEVTITITVAKAKLKEVEFSGPKYDLTSDDRSVIYSTKHWQDNSSPLNGTADDLGDHKYPVCYKRNTKMVAAVKWNLQPSGADVRLKARGRGPDGISFPPVDVGVINDTLIMSETESDTPFKNQIDFYDPLTIRWEFSTDEGRTWFSAGSSANQFLITLNQPKPDLSFHTIAYIGCKFAKGTKTDEEAPDRLFSVFAEKSVPTARGEVMHYYQDWDTQNQHVQTLIAGKDGQCNAWVELLRQVIKMQGVVTSRLNRLQIGGPGDMLVKNWSFAEPPAELGQRNPYIDYALTIRDFEQGRLVTRPHTNGVPTPQVIDNPGVPGQGPVSNPIAVFYNHQILCVNGVLYDPSYGNRFDARSSFPGSDPVSDALPAWQAASLDGWALRSREQKNEQTEGIDLDGNGIIENKDVVYYIYTIKKVSSTLETTVDRSY